MLDPYTCIVKKNRKYASECTEASDLGIGVFTIFLGRVEVLEVDFFF